MLKDRQGMERIQFTDNATKGLVCRILGCSFEHGIGTTKQIQKSHFGHVLGVVCPWVASGTT